MLAPKIHLKYGFFNQNCLDSLEDLNEYNVSQKLNEIKTQIFNVYINNIDNFNDESLLENNTYILIPQDSVENNQYSPSLFAKILSEESMSIEEKKKIVLEIANALTTGILHVGMLNVQDIPKIQKMNVGIDIINPLEFKNKLDHYFFLFLL